LPPQVFLEFLSLRLAVVEVAEAELLRAVAALV
jgi:hypothetical protein